MSAASAVEKLSPKDSRAMFGGEDEAPEEPADDEGENDEDLRQLGEGLMSAVSTGDGLAIAKAVRDIMGDKE